MQVINGAMTRPLDYDYLKSLPPAPQRFYELLSYQMYATIKNDRPRAKLPIPNSAPMRRRPGNPMGSGAYRRWPRCIARTCNPATSPRSTSRQTVDRDGRPDWIMLYVPGPKARAEYRAFTRRGGPTVLEVEPFAADPPPQLAAPGPSPLEAELIGRGITPAMAGELVRDHGEEKIRAQIEQPRLAGRDEAGQGRRSGRLAGRGHPERPCRPKGFVPKAERQRREEARQAQEREQAEQRRRQREQEARDRASREEVDAYLKRLTPAERTALEPRRWPGPAPRHVRYTRRPRPASGPPCCWACCGSTWGERWSLARARRRLPRNGKFE